MSPMQKELWEYVVQLVAWEKGEEKRRVERQKKMENIRGRCLWILQSNHFPDEVALTQIKKLVS